MELIDYHNHSTFSDGELSVQEIDNIAREKNITIGVSDHYSYFIGISDQHRLNNYLLELEKTKLLKSLEICLGANPGIPENLRCKLDYVMGSVHFIKIANMEYVSLWSNYFVNNVDDFFEFYTQEIIRLINSEKFDILGHPLMIPFFIKNDNRFAGRKEFFSIQQIERILDIVRDNGVALELSSRYELPHDEVIKIAIEKKIKFASGSDSHKKANYGDLTFAKRTINKYLLDSSNLFYFKK